MDFEKVQAEWVLDRFPWEKLPDVAAEALVARFEGPFILDLVGYAAPSLHLLKAEVVEGAFREMGLSPIDKAQAVRKLARPVALRILRNQVSPYDGATEIADLVERCPWEERPKDLYEFVCRVEYLDEGIDPNESMKAIIALSWSLVEEDPF